MKSLEERFWNKVNKKSGVFGVDGRYPTECWVWTGAKMTQGYGHIKIKGKNKLSHRLLFSLNGIDLKPEECVLHKCDNRCCVNPDHLVIGTRRDNANDMKVRGRSKGASGTANFNAKLSESDVIKIRHLQETSNLTYKKIANQFGVSVTTVTNIVNRKIWKHI